MQTAVEVRAALGRLADAETQRRAAMDECFDDASAVIAASPAAIARDVAPPLHSVAQRAELLSLRFNSTAEMATQLKNELEQLHAERKRVHEAIHWCSQVLLLKQAIAAWSAALETHDWDRCVAECQSVRGMDSAVVQSQFAQRMVPTAMLPGTAPETISVLTEALLHACTRNFAHYTAPATRSEAEATRFLTYFPKIGAHDAGLRVYTAFARGLAQAQGRDIQEMLETQSPPATVWYGTLWRMLFERLAVLINTHFPVVDRIFASNTQHGFVEGVLPGLSIDWTRLGTHLLAACTEHRYAKRLLHQARASQLQGLDTVRAVPHTAGRIFGRGVQQDRSMPFSLTRPSTPTPPQILQGPDLAMIDTLLSELAMIAHHWALFCRFLRNVLHVEMSSIDVAAQQAPTLAGGVEDALLHTYLPLQLWSLRVGVEKVHDLDTADLEARPCTSSLPDDLFFMLRTMLTRALSTSSLNVLERIVSQTIAVLESDYVEIIVLRMDGCRRGLNIARLVDGPRRTAALREVKATMIVYLNALDTSAEYTERLMHDLQQESVLEQYFDAHDASESSALALAQDVLGRLEMLAPKLRASLHLELGELFGTLIEPHTRTFMSDLVRDLDYALDEHAYARAEEADMVRKRLGAAWNNIMPGYREKLTQHTYAFLFAMAVDAIVQPFETGVLQMRVTELGALRFDKDVRAMLAFLGAQTPWGVRDKFARLQQIAYVLTRDEEEEVRAPKTNPKDEHVDVYEAGTNIGISWQLTPAEVQAVQALRI
ncbi:Golgi transport complex subunit 4 [Malassezia vespertilionis]|uniref:Conserved oligomeric Golgi complex subunit 4 n=1 Tax=Malassezia vespertilionis TaxID=2020962 RepID=A0A2N1JEI2_9BASI|nr:Golgi transport complex subunit 4 [Malassezia vespertilionis]PKI84926.1 hypothetical protein MVES_001079 [Malassezia vespertilionis]WFD05811.1 Golgi transport complex subunit 4 [Malassezia vespertilionis]